MVSESAGPEGVDAALTRQPRPDPVAFIRTNMHLAAVASLREIRLYTAHPGSGLWRLADTEAEESGAPPPYWAYLWAGGAALASHFLDRPETVRGRSVLDLGAGSGIVGIAAAKAGASRVIAAEVDPYGVAALGLNAAANDVVVSVIAHDLTAGPPPSVDLIAVGDLFYERDLAERVTAFLDRCLTAGIDVLIGDPGRAWLPRRRLRMVAQYSVPDVGEISRSRMKPSGVFVFEPENAGARTA